MKKKIQGLYIFTNANCLRFSLENFHSVSYFISVLTFFFYFISILSFRFSQIFFFFFIILKSQFGMHVVCALYVFGHAIKSYWLRHSMSFSRQFNRRCIDREEFHYCVWPNSSMQIEFFRAVFFSLFFFTSLLLSHSLSVWTCIFRIAPHFFYSFVCVKAFIFHSLHFFFFLVILVLPIEK